MQAILVWIESAFLPVVWTAEKIMFDREAMFMESDQHRYNRIWQTNCMNWSARITASQVSKSTDLSDWRMCGLTFTIHRLMLCHNPPRHAFLPWPRFKWILVAWDRSLKSHTQAYLVLFQWRNYLIPIWACFHCLARCVNLNKNKANQNQVWRQ